MKPFFSVIIPLYNKKGYVNRTLESIENQVFRDFEVIIVDDGSTDGSASEVQAFISHASQKRPSSGLKSEKIISYQCVHQINAGAAAARNRGVSEAKGKYLAFLDADDVWFPNHLLVMSELIGRYPEAKLFSTAYQFSHLRDGKSEVETNGATQEGLIDFFQEIRHYFLCINSAVVNADVFCATQGFPVGFKHGEDFAPFMEIALNHLVAGTKTVTSLADRNVPGQITRSGYDKGEIRFLGYLPVLARAFRKHAPLNRSFKDYAEHEIALFLKSRMTWGYFHEFAQIYVNEKGRDAVSFPVCLFYDALLKHVWIQVVTAKTYRGLRWIKRLMRRQSLDDIRACPCHYYRRCNLTACNS